MESKNLDLYGNPLIGWERAVGQLEQREFHAGRGTYWLSTTCADGRPHSAGVLGVWMDGTLYFASGVRSLKSRNLQTNPRCAVSASLPDLDLVMEGSAMRVGADTSSQHLTVGADRKCCRHAVVIQRRPRHI